jgi:hypothetical protein
MLENERCTVFAFGGNAIGLGLTTFPIVVFAAIVPDVVAPVFWLLLCYVWVRLFVPVVWVSHGTVNVSPRIRTHKIPVEDASFSWHGPHRTLVLYDHDQPIVISLCAPGAFVKYRVWGTTPAYQRIEAQFVRCGIPKRSLK